MKNRIVRYACPNTTNLVVAEVVADKHAKVLCRNKQGVEQWIDKSQVTYLFY